MDDTTNTEKTATVLAVDDTPDNLALLSGVLRDHYRIKVANSGEKALRIAQSDTPPDVILLDVMMPEMDGYEVCRRLKADAATRDIPIIFVTAKSEVEDETRGLELGAVDYLSKPISPGIVLARVRNHLALKALRDADKRYRETLEQEKQLLEVEQMRSERLILNILPRPIADRLKRGEKNISGSYPEVSILFSDLVGFTQMSSQISAGELVRLLNDLFTRFDKRGEALGLEKIKTIGDAYMAAGGIPIPRSDHAALCAEMALGMYDDLKAFNRETGRNFAMRIGINSGPVVAGVIGFTKFSYDLWGNTVNTASRMESTSSVGRIQVSPSTYAELKDLYLFEPAGEVECKGLGKVNTHYLLGPK